MEVTRKEIEDRMAELKSDYARLQSDLDKMEAVGRNVAPTEKLLNEMEAELKDLRKKLADLN